MNVSRWCRRVVRATMGAMLPSRLFLVRGPRTGRSVYLTFDDGPHPEHTPQLLDVLRREQVTATFFVIGERAAQNPELVQRIVADGHAIGHHTYYHAEPKTTPAGQLVSEVERTGDILHRTIGFSPNLFRPPNGKLTPAKVWALWRMGMTVALWNVDPRDYTCKSADELGSRLQKYQPRGGDILLFHDDRPYAYGALPEVIARACANDLTFATIPDLLARDHVAPIGGTTSLFVRQS
jgi:peptidoglycan-N-acetylglucosamine deacetylase